MEIDELLDLDLLKDTRHHWMFKYAWLTTVSWNKLHYFPIPLNLWDLAVNDGYYETKAYCGRNVKAVAPGFMTRMGAPRCSGCCNRLNIPLGTGIPLNDPLFKT